MIGGGLHDGDHWSRYGVGHVDCHNHVDGFKVVLTLVNCGHGVVILVVMVVVIVVVIMEVMVVVTKLVMIVVMEVVMNPDGGLRSW